MQIDSFMELPKDKRPPRNIWDDPDELEDWFDRIFDRNKDTGMEILIGDVES